VRRFVILVQDKFVENVEERPAGDIWTLSGVKVTTQLWSRGTS
jgi:hypothetical protein